ncbi:hypothetical protein A2U01_0067433, partial [Trifolium medium]|nr:hypothetical protein [Trifolium medium]
ERPSVGDIVTESNPKGTTEEHSVSEPSQSLSPATEESPEAVQKSKSDKASVDSEVAKPSSQVMIRERPPPPFPQRLRKAKEEKQYDKFIEMMKQLHINIPLIEAIQC